MCWSGKNRTLKYNFCKCERSAVTHIGSFH
jgi:hypothetical protein